MRLPHRVQGQKSKSHGGAYCDGHLAAQLDYIINLLHNTTTMKQYGQTQAG